MKNIDIRLMVSESGVHYTDIAKKMGIGRVWLSKLMSRDLDYGRRRQIIEAIQELKHDRDH